MINHLHLLDASSFVAWDINMFKGCGASDFRAREVFLHLLLVKLRWTLYWNTENPRNHDGTPIKSKFPILGLGCCILWKDYGNWGSGVPKVGFLVSIVTLLVICRVHIRDLTVTVESRVRGLPGSDVVLVTGFWIGSMLNLWDDDFFQPRIQNPDIRVAEMRWITEFDDWSCGSIDIAWWYRPSAWWSPRSTSSDEALPDVLVASTRVSRIFWAAEMEGFQQPKKQ